VKKRAAPRTATFAELALGVANERVSALDYVAWPNTRWAADPVGFAETILGVEPWSREIEVLESVRDNRHTAVSGGRKVSKDHAGGVAALWWFSSFAGGRVMCFGPTMKQIDEILYREIRLLWAGRGRCVRCKRDNPSGPTPCEHSAVIPGKIGISAKTGIEATDLRQVIGVTSAGEGGAIGFSGKLLVIEDEAAHMRDDIDAAIVGNLAGEDCRRLLISNPVKTRGFFFRAFHTERGLCNLITISSEESPNIVQGRTVYPGLASREWLAERERAWGRGSPMWKWHVEGKFLKAEKGQLFSIDSISEAELRWSMVESVGRLHLGLDPAGEGDGGDEIAFAPRRGDQVLEIDTMRGKTPDQILARGLEILTKHRTSTEVGDRRPVVVVDRDGEIGERVYRVLAAHEDLHPDDFELLEFRGGYKPKGLLGQTYRVNRDVLYAGLAYWWKEGGAVPADLMLEAELLEMRWVDHESGRQTLIDKSDLRKLLGRSPDRCDAVALSTWREVQPFGTTDDSAPVQPAKGDPIDGGRARGESLDAYQGADMQHHDQTFDPWKSS
jgi:phage terminase large subunit